MESVSNPTSAIAIVHQSGLKLPKSIQRTVVTEDKWRVRNWKHHPYDPGWEDGRYCICHSQFRRSSTRYEGEVVVDIVNDGNTEKIGYLVRSYFPIRAIEPCRFSRTGGKDLLFDEYHFCDRNPGFYLQVHTAPLGTTLFQHQLEQLLQHPSYQRYQVANKLRPASIAAADWDRMIKARSLKMDELESRRSNMQISL